MRGEMQHDVWPRQRRRPTNGLGIQEICKMYANLLQYLGDAPSGRRRIAFRIVRSH